MAVATRSQTTKATQSSPLPIVATIGTCFASSRCSTASPDVAGEHGESHDANPEGSRP